MCNVDTSMQDSGGIHVIQTFLSEERSEQMQIMGRTARQGTKGSYSMVLCKTDLEIFDPKIPEDIGDYLEKRRSELYAFLDGKRNAHFNSTFEEKVQYADQIADNHDQSRELLKLIKNDNNIPAAMDMLKRF